MIIGVLASNVWIRLAPPTKFHFYLSFILLETGNAGAELIYCRGCFSISNHSDDPAAASVARHHEHPELTTARAAERIASLLDAAFRGIRSCYKNGIVRYVTTAACFLYLSVP